MNMNMKTLIKNDKKPGYLKRLLIGILVFMLGGYPALVFALPQGVSEHITRRITGI